MPKPIFVVGVHRSGTTWIANILCQHPNVSGVVNEKNFGIYESAFFETVMGKFGKLDSDEDFIRFVEQFSLSNFFILSKIDKNIFYEKRPETYPEFFRVMMDSFAKNEMVDFWLEKTPEHSLYIKKISNFYPDAKFIAIKRDIYDTIKSTINMPFYKQKNGKLLHSRLLLLKYLCYRYVKYYKYIEYFSRHSESVLTFNYEQLKESKEEVVTYICKFLGLKFYPELLQEKFRPNTSFSNNQQRKVVLSPIDKILINFFKTIFNFFPYSVYAITDVCERRIRKRKLPAWFYSIVKEEEIDSNKKIEVKK